MGNLQTEKATQFFEVAAERVEAMSPQVAALLRDIQAHLGMMEDTHHETERAVQEYIREEWQPPQPLAQAFKLMLFETGIHEKLGTSAEKIDWYKQHCRRGGYVAPEEMEGLLRKAGWENGVAGWWKVG